MKHIDFKFYKFNICSNFKIKNPRKYFKIGFFFGVRFIKT